MIRWLKQQLRFYLGFSKAESNGTIILVGILILLILSTIIFRKVEEANRAVVYGPSLDSLAAAFVVEDSSVAIPSVALTEFDPHDISSADLQNFGLSTEVARRWIKYVEAGGQFQKPEDIAKIYGIRDEEVTRLLPYVMISEQRPEAVVVVGEESPPQVQPATPLREVQIEINTADSTLLQDIYGIGPVLSRRIIRFRELLGGFVHEGQLGEVYGLDSVTFKEVLRRCYIDDQIPVNQLNINTSSPEALSRHPYITRSQGRNIVSYRNQHGNFTELRSLLRIQTLDSAWFHKVHHYLTVE